MLRDSRTQQMGNHENEKDSTYKATSQFTVLGGGGLSGADSEAGFGDLGAAGRLTVGVVDAAAGGELGAVTGTDTLGTGVVGSQGEGGDGD